MLGPYRSYRGGGLESLVVLVAVVTIVLAGWLLFLVGRLLILWISELIRTYREHGGDQSPAGSILRHSLGAFLVVGGLCSLTALAVPAGIGIAASVGAWSFLAFAVTASSCGF